MLRKEIPYPTRKSEHEIQALLWYFLRKRKIDVRLEVHGFYRVDDGKNIRRRFDAVIFKDQKPVCIIECKSWSQNYSRTQAYRKEQNSKQIQEYENIFGLPVLVVGRFEQIDNTVTEIERMVKT